MKTPFTISKRVWKFDDADIGKRAISPSHNCERPQSENNPRILSDRRNAVDRDLSHGGMQAACRRERRFTTKQSIITATRARTRSSY